MRRSKIERLLDKCQPEPNSGCWLWIGPLNKGGYGIFSWESATSWLAHRASFVLHTGIMPGRLDFICHKCDIKCCINPEHLWMGTPKENSVDASIKGILQRRAKRYGQMNTGSKLTNETVLEIVKDKRPYAFVAEIYGVKPSTIRAIHRGENWGTITGITKDSASYRYGKYAGRS